MSLSSSLFSGISGLSTLGNSMTVIGDNIANINTVGFKKSRVTFQDVLSQTIATSAGSSQVGRGTSLADITSSFAQGSFESTDSTTDLAIGGDGFFVVRDPANDKNVFYTRAGEFRFDKDGNFINPAGYIVRGWALDATTGEDLGSITDVILQSFTSSPKKTDLISVITNLDSDASSKAANLSTSWDGDNSNKQYLGENLYEYQTTIKAYDSLGSTHDVTIYFDKGASSQYEYIVTANPTEDNRTSVPLGSNGSGMLGRGTISFGQGSGKIESITFEKFIGNAGGIGAAANWGGASSADATSYGEYTGTATLPSTFTYTATVAGGPATVSAAGTSVAASIAYTNGAGETGTIAVPTTYTAGTILQAANGIQVSFPAGTIVTGDTFTVAVTAGDPTDLTDSDAWATMTTTNSLTNSYFTFTTDFLGGTNTSMDMGLDFGSAFNNTTASWANGSLTTTQFSSASTTTFQSANGYGAGDLQSVTVGIDGAITGQYSNGQVIPLYRVALAKFQNNQALFKLGGNLFTETRLSGDPTTSRPGTNGLGSISPNSLEQSNVDIANEFVKMIITQRGFQANSKIITVTDQMLAELINLKR